MIEVTPEMSRVIMRVYVQLQYRRKNNIMDIRVFSKYYQYSLKDKVIPIRCGLDADHPYLVPNLNDDDIVFLYCLGCSYKMFPGMELYNNIEFILEEMEVNGED